MRKNKERRSLKREKVREEVRQHSDIRKTIDDDVKKGRKGKMSDITAT